MDRGELTRAGRALDKHGGRQGSVFPKAIGNINEKNIQGQFQLDDILTYPKSTNLPNKLEGIDFYRPNGSGARFDKQGRFSGFLEPNSIRK